MADEMSAANLKTMLVFSESKEMPLLKEFLESGRFEHRAHIRGKSFGSSQDVDVFSL
ncbi:MAG: hypothetical protein Q8R76_06120 [Candidatus Omnitrophota bacterium]|nr:hypothetical protein [Candidatus Omnitrophota bacterium]